MVVRLLKVIKEGRTVLGYEVANQNGQVANLSKQAVEKLAINKEVYGVKAQHYKDKILLRDDGISISDLPVLNVRNSFDRPKIHDIEVTERSMDRKDIDNQISNKARTVKKIRDAIITYVDVKNGVKIPSVIRIYTNDVDIKNQVDTMTFPGTTINTSKVIKSTKDILDAASESSVVYQYAFICTNAFDRMENVEKALNSISTPNGTKLKIRYVPADRAIDVDSFNYSEKCKSTLSVRQIAIISGDKLDAMSYREQMLNLLGDYIIYIDDTPVVSDRTQGRNEYATTIEFNFGEVNRKTIDQELYKTVKIASTGLCGKNIIAKIEDVEVESDDETLSRAEQIEILKYFNLVDKDYKDPKLGEEYTGKRYSFDSFLIMK